MEFCNKHNLAYESVVKHLFNLTPTTPTTAQCTFGCNKAFETTGDKLAHENRCKLNKATLTRRPKTTEPVAKRQRVITEELVSKVIVAASKATSSINTVPLAPNPAPLPLPPLVVPPLPPTPPPTLSQSFMEVKNPSTPIMSSDKAKLLSVLQALKTKDEQEEKRLKDERETLEKIKQEIDLTLKRRLNRDFELKRLEDSYAEILKQYKDLA